MERYSNIKSKIFIEKRIDLNDNNRVIFNSISSNSNYTRTITKSYQNDGNLIKTFSLTIDDDIIFSAWCFDDSECIDFEFDINDPLFFPLNRFLNYVNLLEDDNTKELLKKYLEIKKEKFTIKVSFYNKNEKTNYDIQIFIKNICDDIRSKTDFKTKDKIIKLMNEFIDVLFEKYHQMTYDEYIEILRYKKEVINDYINAYNTSSNIASEVNDKIYKKLYLK